MKVSQAVDYHLQYHRANFKKNTVKTCEFVLSRFITQFGDRELNAITQEEILKFLIDLTHDKKQATKRNRYSVLSSLLSTQLSPIFPIPAALLSSERYSGGHNLFSGKLLIKKQ